MHEVFLCRLASHSAFRNDINFRVFLEFEDDVSCCCHDLFNIENLLVCYSQLMVRGKNKKERLGSILKSFSKSADEVLLSGQKVMYKSIPYIGLNAYKFCNKLQDVDDFFEHEKTYLVEYHTHIRDTTNKAQRMFFCHKSGEINFIISALLIIYRIVLIFSGMADTIIKIASTFEAMATVEKSDELHKYACVIVSVDLLILLFGIYRWFLKTAEGFEKVRVSD